MSESSLVLQVRENYLPKVPSRWKIRKFKYSISFQEGPGIMAVDFRDSGTPLIRIRNVQEKFVNLEGSNFLEPEMVESQWAQYRCKKEDLIISCSASTGLVSEIGDESVGVIAYTGLIRLWPEDDSIKKDFIRYLVSSDLFYFQILMLKTGSTMQHFGPEHLRKMLITVPPLPTQQKIADFLDRKTAQIDGLIEKKRQLIAKLKEKRLAVITQAVTRGLNPDLSAEASAKEGAPLKDSGIEWLGQVPKHWKVMSLHHLVRMRSGEAITSSNIDEQGKFLVYGGNGRRGFTEDYTHDGEYVLIGRQGAHCGNIQYATGKFWASEHAVVANPDWEFDTHWLGETLRVMNLNQYSVSAAQPGLSVEAIGKLKLPVPPLKEQQNIAKLIENETHKIDGLSKKTKATIDRLTEYRTALITAAVTGQLEVN